MKNTNNTKQCNIHDDMISSSYPEFKIVSIIASACLKHSDSGEGNFNKEARVILMELENNGYVVIKKQ